MEIKFLDLTRQYQMLEDRIVPAVIQCPLAKNFLTRQTGKCTLPLKPDNIAGG